MLFYYTRNRAALRILLFIMIEIISLSAAQSFPLRAAVLRAGLAPQAVDFGDEQTPDARHFGALLDGELVGTGYIVPNAEPDDIDADGVARRTVGSCAECRWPTGCAGAASDARCCYAASRRRAPRVRQCCGATPACARLNYIDAKGLSAWATPSRSSASGRICGCDWSYRFRRV